MPTDFDTDVKLSIYGTIARTGIVPSSYAVAGTLGKSVAEVEASFTRLHIKRLLVPEPGDSSRIRMAPPFSAIETPFPVQVGEMRYYANCIWDALGIAAALHTDVTVDASDGFTSEPITLEVRDGKPVPNPAVIHFAVPAALWWQDIIYT